MALNIDELRNAVNEQSGKEIVPTEADLEAEKVKLREEIKILEEAGVTEKVGPDGLISLNYLALQIKRTDLAELEEMGLAGMESKEGRMMQELQAKHERGELKHWQDDSE